MIKQLELGDCNPTVTPTSNDERQHVECDRELHEQDAKLYRGIAAKCNYVSHDRSDITYATNELCQRMSNPRHVDWNKAKRLIRYLSGAGEWKLLFRWQSPVDKIVTFSD